MTGIDRIVRRCETRSITNVPSCQKWRLFTLSRSSWEQFQNFMGHAFRISWASCFQWPAPLSPYSHTLMQSQVAPSHPSKPLSHRRSHILNFQCPCFCWIFISSFAEYQPSGFSTLKPSKAPSRSCCFLRSLGFVESYSTDGPVLFFEPSCSWPAVISLQICSSGEPLIVYSFLLI